MTLLDQDPENYLICRLAKTKVGYRALGNYPLSYSTIRKHFLTYLKPGLPSDQQLSSYSLHSLRSGGATTATNNGVDIRLVGKHGRWKSTTARDTYIKDSKKARLSVTEKLGI